MKLLGTKKALLRSTVANPAASFTGAFDGITFAALYGLKRFLTSYTGNLVRLRRDSDNAESDFGYVAATGLLDTAAIATWLGGANGFVVTWYDQSGNGRDAAQTTASKQNAYAASGINSLPSLNHDNTDDGLEIAYVMTGAASIIAAVKTPAAARGSFVKIGTPVGGTGYTIGVGGATMDSTGVNLLYLREGLAWEDTGADLGAGTFVVSVIKSSLQAWVVYKDGGTAVVTDNDTHTTPATTSYLGNYEANPGIANRPYNGDLACVALAASAFSAADHNTIGNALGTLYNVTWNTVS